MTLDLIVPVVPFLTSKPLSLARNIIFSPGLNRTIQRKQIRVSNLKELNAQLVFSLENPEQHKGIKSFKHAVSRCMKILADGNWSTLHGFQNHDEQGRALKAERTQKQATWQKEKLSASASGIEDLIQQRKKRSEKESLTEKALTLAKGLMNLSKKRQEKGASEIFEKYAHQLKELFAQGADREKVAIALKG